LFVEVKELYQNRNPDATKAEKIWNPLSLGEFTVILSIITGTSGESHASGTRNHGVAHTRGYQRTDTAFP
jgi:hypothetical protein